MRLPLLLAALVLFSACDAGSYDDGYDDGLNDAPTSGATFVDFARDPGDYTLSDDTRTAGYETDDIDSGTTRTAVERALATAGDGALVMLYIDSRLVNRDFGGESTPYSALPLSRGFEQVVLTSGPNGTTTTVPVVGYTASYEFSFDNNDLYFDVVSSTPASSFTSERALFDFIRPQPRDLDGIPTGATSLRFRLVTVPAREGQRPVDMSDYAAVKAAYNLPD